MGDSAIQDGDRVLPAISVVIPTYNRAHCLPRSLESVLRQTFDDFEVIVVDDGSSDDTVAYLETVTDPRLRVIVHERNRGGSAARNTGIHAARGALVAFQDSDDEWLVTKLERQVAAYRKADAAEFGAIYCGKLTYGQEAFGTFGPRRAYYAPLPQSRVVEGDILLQLLRTPMISTQTLLVRKDCLDEIGGFDETLKIGQDWDLTARLARITKFLFVEEPLGICFLEPDSLSHGKRRNLAGAKVSIMEKHADIVSKHPKLHADLLIDIARTHQRYGAARQSLGYAASAVRLAPFRLRSWMTLALGLAMAPFAKSKPA